MVQAPVMAVVGLLPQMENSMLFLLLFKVAEGIVVLVVLWWWLNFLDKIKCFYLFLQTELLLPFCQIFKYRHQLVIYLFGSDCCP